MFKIIYFLWRRPDMSHDEFARYYEEKHTHNNARIRPASRDYRRNYPLPGDSWTGAGVSDQLGGFDVMAENSYVDRAGFAAVLDAITRSPGKELIAQDEARFEVRDAKKVFVVHEVGGLDLDAPDYEPRARRNEEAGFKLLRFVSRAPALSRASFEQRYEREVAPWLTAELAGCIDYRRNYVRFDDPMSFTGSHDAPRAADEASFRCDMVEEIWYSSRATASADHGRFEAAIDVTGRTGVVDLKRSPILVVAEHRTVRPSVSAL